MMPVALSNTLHKPIFCQEIAQLFVDAPEPLYFLDATFGRGGHSQLFLTQHPTCEVLALDRDADAIAFGNTAVAPHYNGRLTLKETLFSSLLSAARGWCGEKNLPLTPGYGPFCGILLDVGVSSPQLDEGARGFSFLRDGPLNMTMGHNTLTAQDIVNTYDEKDLANIFFYYGEERHSRRVAKAIVAARHKKSFTTTGQLSDLVEEVLGKRPGQRIHAATKIFQALRIAVNNELQELKEALPQAASLLRPGGRMVVLTFHALEDRLVKTFFLHHGKACGSPPAFTHISKKPLVPTWEEIQDNPRSRCAKMRWALRGDGAFSLPFHQTN